MSTRVSPEFPPANAGCSVTRPSVTWPVNFLSAASPVNSFAAPSITRCSFGNSSSSSCTHAQITRGNLAVRKKSNSLRPQTQRRHSFAGSPHRIRYRLVPVHGTRPEISASDGIVPAGSSAQPSPATHPSTAVAPSPGRPSLFGHVQRDEEPIGSLHESFAPGITAVARPSPL